jgi:H+/Cl- antiporter ClcA
MSYVFLELLDRVTELREEDAPWLVWLLAPAAFVIVAVYHHVGGRAAQGSALVVDQVHEPTDDGVPARMAPLVLFGTVAAHLFGASVGREGTALQMSGSVADSIARVGRFSVAHRRELLVAALAGGFGSVFGVPVAGAVFALEVPSVGRIRHDAVLAAFVASFSGDAVVRALGHEHAVRPVLELGVDLAHAPRLAVAGVAFGLVATLFVRLTHALKRRGAELVGYPPVRAAMAGAAVTAFAVVVDDAYLGLSLPLAAAALAGLAVGPFVWAAKLFVTSVSLAGGLPGGEVTPLFVIGSTLGAALAGPLGLPSAALAGVGFVAVFGAAANTPLACTVLAVELFGGGLLAPAAITCVVAYLASSHRGIYPTQRVEARKRPRSIGP